MSSETSTTRNTSTSRWRPRGNRISEKRRDAAAIAFLLIAITIFWGRFLRGGLVFYARDFGFFFAPLRAAFAQAIRSGASPLWNPSLGAGVPMAADPNNAVFFPATLLFLRQPFSSGSRAAHMLWAYAFPLLAFAALRRLGMSRRSATVTAFAMAISGPAMTLASLPTTAWAIVFFLPLLAEWNRPASDVGRACAAAGAFIGLIVLAGEPAIAVEILALAVLFRFLSRERLGWKGAIASLGIGLAVGAPQIVSAAELVGRTVRGSGLAVASGAAYYSVRPARLFAALWPGIFGDVHSASPAGFWGGAFFDAGAPYISTLAIGTATVILLPAALRDVRGRRLLVLAAAATVLSFGRHVPGGATVLGLPGLSLFRYPEKWLFFALIAAVGAAGFALERLRSGDGTAARNSAVAAGIVGSASLVGWSWTSAVPARAAATLASWRVIAPGFLDTAPSILGSIRREFAVTGAFAAIALLCATALRRQPGRMAAAFVVLLFLDLFPRTWNSVPLETRDYFDTPPAAAAAVKNARGRFFFDSETEIAPDPLRPMRPAMWGIDFAGNNDIDRFSPRRSFLFGRAVASLSFSDTRKLGLLRLADVSAVSTIDPSALGVLHPWFSTSSHRMVFRVDGGDRFRFFASAIRVGDEEEARTRLLDPRFEREKSLIVENGEPAQERRPGGPVIRILRRRSDRETVSAAFPSGGYLFRAETYDPHWKAQVDGRPMPVVPADFAFQAVPISAGAHQIEFSYSDPAVAAAMTISLASLMLAAALQSRRRVTEGRSRRTR